MGFNEVLSSWSSSEEEDGHDHDEDRDQVIPKISDYPTVSSTVSYTVYDLQSYDFRRTEIKNKKKSLLKKLKKKWHSRRWITIFVCKMKSMLKLI